eukprot:Sspe_Gene.81799::Locus_52924_Transcript_2_2_Confidence_0.500_Length_2501::g.81799::m.81799
MCGRHVWWLLVAAVPAAVHGICDEGWFPVNGRCYSSTPLLGRSDAEAKCRQDGAALATFASLADAKAVVDRTCWGSASLWVGLQKNPQGDWEWEDPSVQYTSFNPWKGGSPGAGDCAVLNGAAFEAAGCSVGREGLCMKEEVGLKGWIRHNESVFTVTELALPFSDALDECSKLHGAAQPRALLGTPDFAFLRDHFPHACFGELWSGFFCGRDPMNPKPTCTLLDQYSWVDINSITVNPLDPNSPGSGGCGATTDTGYLRLQDCTTPLRMVCAVYNIFLPAPTPSPPTPSPPTPTPPTPSPPTTSPSTPSPPTPSPSTRSPRPPLPLPVTSPPASFIEVSLAISRTQLQRAVDGVSAASGVVSGVRGAHLAMMVRGCAYVDSLPLILHPTQLSLGGSTHSIHVGCVVGNCAVVVGLFLAQRVAVDVLNRVKGGTGYRWRGLARYPSVALSVAVVLMQGTLLAALRLSLSGLPWEQGLGCCVVLASLAFIGCVWHRLSDVHSKARYRPNTGTSWVDHLFRQGEWESVDEWYAERYQLVLSPYNTKVCRFVVIDMVVSTALALVASVEVDSLTGCGVQAVGRCAVSVLHGVVTTMANPHTCRRNAILDGVKSVLLAMACVLTSLGYYSSHPSHWGFRASGVLFVLAGVVIALRGALEIVGLAIDALQPSVKEADDPPSLPMATVRRTVSDVTLNPFLTQSLLPSSSSLSFSHPLYSATNSLATDLPTLPTPSHIDLLQSSGKSWLLGVSSSQL